jgi:hypothetical protein
MNAFLKRAQDLSTEELMILSDAISDEMDRRMRRIDAVPDSARRRSNRRQHSYCQNAGSAAPPIHVVGFSTVQRPCVA